MTTLTLMTFNLRTGNMPDGANHWDHRKDLVARLIRGIDPDILGAQEALAGQYDFLRGQFESAYHLVGVCREDGCRAGEAAPILLRRERFDLLASGTFWLSETPQAVGSKGWDGDWPRICTWARVRGRRCSPASADRSAEILVLNTHLDHAGPIARREGAKLLRRFMAEQGADAPLLLMGDFNVGPESEPHRILLDDADDGVRLFDAYRHLHPQRAADEATWHGFTGAADGSPIDWILCSPHFHVESCDIDRTRFDGRYPSDHFPVTAKVRMEC